MQTLFYECLHLSICHDSVIYKEFGISSSIFRKQLVISLRRARVKFIKKNKKRPSISKLQNFKRKIIAHQLSTEPYLKNI